MPTPTLRSTVQKIRAVSNGPGIDTTITLNSVTGGDWSLTPQIGDIMMVIVYYCDDSLAPNFSGPAGWVLIRNNTFVSGSLVFQIYHRVVTGAEGFSIWNSVNNGQGGQVFCLHGFCLTGAFTGQYNPFGQDPTPFNKVNQAANITQTAPNAIVANPTSALLAGWGNNVSSPAYATINVINGVVPITLFDNAGGFPVSVGMAIASGLWLGPGNGNWSPTATLAAASVAQWGAVRWGIKAAPTPPPTPLPPLPIASSSIQFVPKKRRRYLKGFP